MTVFDGWQNFYVIVGSLFHVLLPLVAYVVLAISAFSIATHTRSALFLVGAAVLMLLFIGIHNAWDDVTYHVFVMSGKEE